MQECDSPGALEDALTDKDKSKTGLITKRDAKGVFKNNVRKLIGKKESSKNISGQESKMSFVGVASAVLKKSQTIK